MSDDLPEMPDDHYAIQGEPHRLYTEQQMREYARAALSAALAAAWVPVAEQMPEPGTEVLVWIDGKRGPSWSNNHALVAYWSAYGDGWLQERHRHAERLIGVTHWMPLPASPKG